MKSTPALIFLWWWCLWWCDCGGGCAGAVVVRSASPTERRGDQQQATLPLISEKESQLIIRRKLLETAANFEGNLKSQLSGVETEIYGEFLSILEALGDSQENLTQGISEILRHERAEVLRKVDKVATYSSILVENLYRDLKKLFTELGIWTEEDPKETSVLYSHQRGLLDGTYGSDSSSTDNETYRSKRHMLDWNLDSYSSSFSSDEASVNQNTDDLPSSSYSSFSSPDEALRSKGHVTEWDFDSEKRAQNLAKYEPFKEEELEEILASFDHMNFAGPQDDPDTTSYEWTSPHDTGIPENNPQSETAPLPRDCLDLLESGMAHDGVYTIYPTGLGVRARCDMTSLGGGWTVVASRRTRQAQVNFSRPLLHYQFGFGDPETQHWLGLDHMHALTSSTNSTLRVVLHHPALAAPLHATYHAFSVDSREEGYRLSVGSYDPTSTAADALSPHSGASFVCPDPRYSGNSCVEEVDSGWWFLEAPLCYLALPTGEVFSPELARNGRGSLTWLGLQYSPESMLLMTRREGQSG